MKKGLVKIKKKKRKKLLTKAHPLIIIFLVLLREQLTDGGIAQLARAYGSYP